MENPIKMDDLGGPPLFLETSICCLFFFVLKFASSIASIHVVTWNLLDICPPGSLGVVRVHDRDTGLMLRCDFISFNNSAASVARSSAEKRNG